MSQDDAEAARQRGVTFDFFMRAITPVGTNTTYSILRAHLAFEEVIDAYLERELPSPTALESARLTFAQKLAVARALSDQEISDDWSWQGVKRLNKLRNMLSHQLEPATLSEEIQSYIDFVTTQSGKPLPTPKAGGSHYRSPKYGEHAYSAVDMVNGGLFTYFSSGLGFDLQFARKALGDGGATADSSGSEESLE